MILSRLQLVNFRQYRRLNLQFKDGITGIVGRNGSGKSTILEAVLWCLFGNRAARTEKEGIKRQGASPSEPCSVELEFVLGRKTYCLNRSLVGKSLRSEAQLSQQEQFDAVSTRQVDDYVVRLIGLNLKGFLSSFFARQKELNALSEARPAERKDHLAKMLGVGRLDNAIQLLKNDIKETRQKIDVLKDYQIDPKAVNLEIENRKSEIEELNKGKGKLASTLDNLQKEIAMRVQRVDRLRQDEKLYNRLEKEHSAILARKGATEKEITGLSSELSALQEVAEKLEPLKRDSEGIKELEYEVAGLRQAKSTGEEKNRLEKDLSRLQKIYAARQQDEDKIKKEAASLEESLKEKGTLLKNIAENEAGIDAYVKEHREVTAEVSVVEDKLSMLEKQKAEINELGSDASCKLCLRPFSGEIDEIERHFDQEILSYRQQAKSMKRKIDEVTAKGKRLRQKLASQKLNIDKLNKYEQNLASATANLKSLREFQEDTQQRINEYEKRLEEIGRVEFDPSQLAEKENTLKKKQKSREEYIRLAERAARQPGLESSLKKAQENLESINSQLNKVLSDKKELGFDAEVFQEAVSGLEKAREEAAGIRVEIEKSDGKIRLLTSEAEAGARRLAEYEKSKAEIAQLRDNLVNLEKLSILFAEFRVYLIGRIRPSLSKLTSQLFREMTAERYQEIELDQDYNLRVFDRGEDFAINRFSGGEVDLANLCFRLAISVEMAATAGIEQSFIILDEIFGSQDAERQRMIFEGLGRLKKRFRQIIIISHIDDVKEMAENIISVEVDRLGVSQAVTIEN